MTADGIFPAKVILFGEYSVLLGSASLGIPLREHRARLVVPAPGNRPLARRGAAQHSRQQLERFATYLRKSPYPFDRYLDLAQFFTDIGNGLYLSSSIPPGCGLGSSGALCAAVYSRYGRERPRSWSALLQILGEMESFFHGASSGFDPLISLLDRPLMRTGRTHSGVLPWSTGRFQETPVYLVDSGLRAGTAGLVNEFVARHRPDGRNSPFGESLRVVTDRCISSCVDRGTPAEAFREALDDLSRLQLGGLSHLIPGSIRDLWEAGLEDRSFTLKLCGSGGGGYFLLFMHHRERAEKSLSYVKPTPVYHDNHVDQSAEGHSAHYI